MKRNATVFILLGQSNAVGHNLPMNEKDIISEPLTHVFGLSREKNQRLDPDKLTFSGYTSSGMNLAETQDDTYSLANCLAMKWEAAAREDSSLPDLYIVHIAVGAQGVGREYMWNPDYPLRLIPGPLGTVRISLFPYTERILSLIKPYFEERGVSYDFLGLHWRGGENDTGNGMPEEIIPQIKPIYRQLFDMFARSLGEMPPTVLYEIEYGMKNSQRTDGVNVGNMMCTAAATNEMFREFARESAEITTFDPFSLTLYNKDEPLTWNIFKEDDGVHYTAEANAEIASNLMKQAMKKRHSESDKAVSGK